MKLKPNQRCRFCGCTNDDCRGCIELTGKPCWWVQKDLCSACAGREGVFKDMLELMMHETQVAIAANASARELGTFLARTMEDLRQTYSVSNQLLDDPDADLHGLGAELDLGGVRP